MVVHACTPIWLDLDAPTPFILWADLTDMDWSEASFHDTVARAVQENPRRTRLRTGLEALDEVEGSDPLLGIFHAAPAGSAVVSEALARRGDVHVIRQAAPINAVLASSRPFHERVGLLRRVVGALARPHGRPSVLELFGWNVRHVDLFRAAFPSMMWIFVYGEPGDMLEGVWPRRATWLGFQAEASEAARRAGLDPATADAAPEEFYAQAIARVCEAALEALDDHGRLVHERSLPEAIDRFVLPLARLSSREGRAPREVAVDDEAELPPPAIREVAERWLADVCARLRARDAG